MAGAFLVLLLAYLRAGYHHSESDFRLFVYAVLREEYLMGIG